MSAFFIVVYVVCGVYMVLNFKHDIHMLQQNSYRLPRYWKYLRQDIGSTWRLVDVALLFLVFSTLLDVRLSALFVALVSISKIWLILRKKFKKPLVFTKRVWRLYSVSSVISIVVYVTVVLVANGKASLPLGYTAPALSLGALLLMTIFSWAIVMLAVVALMPVEKMINRKYWNEAASILRSMPSP